MSLTQVKQSNIDTSASELYGFRNRIINGDMRIDQRNAGASITPTVGTYTLDRFTALISQASKFSVQQNAASVTPPVGFTNYLGATSLSAYTVGSAEYYLIAQKIEGYNIADLGWGTADAKTVTLSFWVRSSLTGTFGGALRNSAANRSYPFSYAISVANTWEQKSITIAGDTTGTWLTTNGIGVNLYFGLGVGSSNVGTAGAWVAANYNSSTGATSVVGTSGATFYITGVQLEVGSVATPFERRPYGTELSLCQRYYEKSYDAATVPGTATTTSFGNAGETGQSDGTKNGCVLVFKVPKRASANMAYWDGAGTSNRFTTRHSNTWYSGRTLTAVSAGENSAVIDAVTGVQAPMLVHYTASAEL
jgi:hypothetical protein